MVDEVKNTGVGFWNTAESDMRKLVAYLKNRGYDVATTENVVYVLSGRNFHELTAEFDQLCEVLDRTLGTDALNGIPEMWTLHKCCRKPAPRCSPPRTSTSRNYWQSMYKPMYRYTTEGESQ
jgi:hypothetical protein